MDESRRGLLSVGDALSRGVRHRKEVDYSQDLMSDREWLKTINEDVDEDEFEEEVN